MTLLYGWHMEACVLTCVCAALEPLIAASDLAVRILTSEQVHILESMSKFQCQGQLASIKGHPTYKIAWNRKKRIDREVNVSVGSRGTSSK